MTPAVAPEAAIIRGLNDRLRADFLGGQVMVTIGVRALGPEFLHSAIFAVRGYSQFDDEDDPEGEHNFGALNLLGTRLLWKIDYYDLAMESGSEDPSDPSVTTRVLTILLADEW